MIIIRISLFGISRRLKAIRTVKPWAELAAVSVLMLFAATGPVHPDHPRAEIGGEKLGQVEQRLRENENTGIIGKDRGL